MTAISREVRFSFLHNLLTNPFQTGSDQSQLDSQHNERQAVLSPARGKTTFDDNDRPTLSSREEESKQSYICLRSHRSNCSETTSRKRSSSSRKSYALPKLRYASYHLSNRLVKFRVALLFASDFSGGLRIDLAANSHKQNWAHI
jgi:hypothetical protein